MNESQLALSNEEEVFVRAIHFEPNEDEPRLVHFIDRLAELVRGRVFSVNDRELGATVVRDYVRGRR